MRHIIFATLICLIATVTTNAQVPIRISHQGVILVDGVPLEGYHDLRFSIYEAGASVPLWTELQPGVEFDGGLFQVHLGVLTVLPHTVFDGEDRLLGVAVDDLEELPKTLLTSVPGAAFTRSVRGDVATGPGSLSMHSVEGDKLIEMIVTGDGSVVDAQAFGLSADASESQMAGSQASIYMFNPQPEPPARALEFTVDQALGPQLRAFDVFGPVLAFEGAPANEGYQIVLKDPEDERTLVEVSSEYGTPKAGHVSVFDRTLDRTSHLTGGNLHLQGAGDENPIVLIAADDGARLGIGTDNPTEALHVVGNGYFTGEVVHITTTRAKHNIVPITGALDLVSRMNGYYFDYRNSEFPELKMPEGRGVGFLAEEVKDILPEAVRENKSGFSGVSYSRVTALLVEAVKELQAENESLRARLSQLEAAGR